MRSGSNGPMASTAVQRIRRPSKHFRDHGISRRVAAWLAILFALCAHTNYMGDSMIPLCYANPLPTSLIRPSSQSALLLATSGDIDGDRMSFDRRKAAAQTNRVGNLTRQHGGDVFYAFGEFVCL